MKRKAFTAKGATIVGPYSQAVEMDGFVFISGQIPLDPKTGKQAEGGIVAQTRQPFTHLFAMLAAANLSPDNIIKALPLGSSIEIELIARR